MTKYRENMAFVDTAWLRMERPTNLMMITGVMILEEPLSMSALTRLIEQRLGHFDRFRQRVVMPSTPLGTPHWEFDPHFDIRSHIHHIALPAPGDQAALEAVVSDIASTPLDFSKPLWSYHLVDGVGSGCALVGRLHHCIADGIALMAVLLSLTDDSPTAYLEEAEEPDSAESPHKPGLLEIAADQARSALYSSRRLGQLIRHESAETVAHPYHALALAKAGANSAARLAKITLYPADPDTIFRGELSALKRAAWSQPILLNDVKTIGRQINGTVNDVILAAVAGALRHYLEGRGQPLDGISIRAFVPVNIRPLDQALELGNKFGLVMLSLPLGVADRYDRLLAVKAGMDEIKSSPEAVVSWAVLTAMGVAPAPVEELGLQFFQAKTTAVMSNVPGPRHPVYLAGKRLKTVLGWAPASGDMGLSVTIISYDGQIWVGMMTNAQRVPDPGTIIANFQAEFAELRDLAAGLSGEPETPVSVA